MKLRRVRTGPGTLRSLEPLDSEAGVEGAGELAGDKAGEAARPEKALDRRIVFGVMVWSVDTLLATLSIDGRERSEGANGRA